MAFGKITLKRTRENSVKRFHPWIFSGAIANIEGSPSEGDVVDIYSSAGEYLGFGHYQIGSITVRMLSFEKERISGEFWESALKKVYLLRSVLMSACNLSSFGTNAYRLVHGEGDGLPGLIIDYYNGIAVIQAHSSGMFRTREVIAEVLKQIYGESLKAIYDKSSRTAPFKAGLNLEDGYIYGSSGSGDGTLISENGHLFHVDWEGGQKTGFFLDQRDNRLLVKKYADGKKVLNLFCYTGGFSIYALAGGAISVDSVDGSQKVVDLLDNNVSLNRECGIISGSAVHASYCEDVTDFMRKSANGKYDLIIVDPPAFAKHRNALPNALRAYQRLNASAIGKIAPGGMIFTFSCSQLVDKNIFAETVFSAAIQAGMYGLSGV